MAERVNNTYDWDRTKPKGPITGKQVKKCYAARLNDCDGPLEKEHPFAKCGLVEFSENNIIITTGWVGNQTIPLSVNNISAGILCHRHNNALGTIDDTLKKWVKSVKILHANYIYCCNYININSRYMALILLQMACGFAAIKKKPIPLRWIQILFSMIDYDIQLYQYANVGSLIKNEMEMNAGLHHDMSGFTLQVKGAILAIFIDSQIPNEFIPAKKIKLMKENELIFQIKFM